MNISWPKASGSCGGSGDHSEAEVTYGGYAEIKEKKPSSKKIKHRRYRSAFTTEQINYLENVFKKGPYVNSTQRQEIAVTIGLTDRCVKVWFQNRRMKEKQIVKEKEDDESYQNQQGHVNCPSTASNSLSSERSLPILTSQNHVTSVPSFTPASHTSQDKITEQRRLRTPPHPYKPNYYQDISPVQDHQPTPAMYTNSAPVPTYSNEKHVDYTASAEFSIDLCKKYKNILKQYKSESSIASDRSFHKPQNQYKSQSNIGSDKSFQKPKSTESRSFNKTNQPQRVEVQDAPQDLSMKKLNSMTMHPAHTLNTIQDNRSHPVYVNFPQPFYGDGNMMWNQLTLPAAMSNTVPAANISIMPQESPISSEYFVPKESCNCCKCPKNIPLRNQTYTQNSEPKYIINVIPYQNYPNF